jgi:hypothetical protein
MGIARILDYGPGEIAQDFCRGTIHAEGTIRQSQHVSATVSPNLNRSRSSQVMAPAKILLQASFEQQTERGNNKDGAHPHR